MEPGYCGKFYFGNSSLNPASGTGLYKTLFPNCLGGWSEEFVAIPDSIVNVPASLNIAAEFSTDALSSEALAVAPYGGSGSTSSQSVAGGTAVLSSTPTAMGTGFVHRITISVTPGQVGQVFIGTSAMSTDLGGIVAILYPNSVGRWSEQFDLIDPQGDGIDLSALYILGEVPGEYVASCNRDNRYHARHAVERLPGQRDRVSGRLYRQHLHVCGTANGLSGQRADFRGANSSDSWP